MSEKYNYRLLYPGDKEWERNSFHLTVCHLIDDWPRIKSEGTRWPTPAKVNAELEKLRRAISSLSEYTRDQIIGRERDALKFMSQEWINAGKGQSSLEILEKSVAPRYERSGRSDGHARRYLGFAALDCWYSAGGITYDDKDSRAKPIDKAKFLNFLEQIFTDIGEERFDSERMYRDIFDKRE